MRQIIILTTVVHNTILRAREKYAIEYKSSAEGRQEREICYGKST